ncbi:hypothetical protein BJF93_23380 [Xaviernesmea oryzae]|uniref:Protein TonB n=1 Tax=Xaviernesmea oryzae TaxID=464029 RepID=A0A1Q9B2S4_9HYPH|nr:TonB family protein [Xaviernesmea oryzae]OLP62308.1 hypothetical protein BJF93_23380 [Xaviernesmea oryzae]SEL96306.1 protein TonB [Xaviernesmea oryzae]
MSKTLRWTVGIGLSLCLHAVAGAVILMPKTEAPDMLEGGQAMQVAMLGNAFEETLQAGAPNEVLSPSEQPTETAEIDPLAPTEIAPETVTPQTSESVAPQEIAPNQPVQTATVPLEPPAPPVDADVVMPEESLPPVSQTPPDVVAAAPPVETVVPLERPEPPKPEKPQPPKPELSKKPEPKKVAERETPRRAKPTGGEKGAARESARKGEADGAETANAATSSAGSSGRSSDAGNAAASRYQQMIQSRLRRANKYPSEAQRDGLRGTVVVSFLIGPGGSVSRVSVLSSSGSAVLDQAAMDNVRRAAPFPAIPAAVDRTSWLFKVPLEFKR